MSLIASLVDEETIDFEPRTAEEREMDREAVSNIRPAVLALFDSIVLF